MQTTPDRTGETKPASSRQSLKRSLRRRTAASAAAEHVAALGDLVRRSRLGRFTLEELAAAAGVSSGLISQIERGQGNPSLVTLLKLAHALQIPMAQFFHGSNNRRMLVTEGDGMKMEFPGEGRQGLVYELLSPDFQRQMVVMKAQIPDHWDNSDEPFSRSGEECVHVLSGRLEMRVGENTFTLRAGDTLSYDSGLPHSWRNESGGIAHVILALTPPPA